MYESVVQRSGSNNKCFYLCESGATATNVFICAKAKRQQQQMFLSVRKRSDSNNKCFYLCESEAT
ncbi:hypothetical protein ACIQXF_10635, partial [Lysinibacillus sp. NPDC097231]|uniref:hypothetical protein n=1 Tax=Lysinibacillus sp. NPDC097231 TaxID=3364142 RepID=UPI0037F48AE7